MDFGDRPPSAIFATSFFMAALLTESSGRSPTFALIHLSRAYVHVSSVEGARGLCLRFRIWSSQIEACSRKVIPWTCRTTSLKYSSVSTPLAAMISLALRSRSDAESLPGPAMGQIFSRTRCLLSCPGTSLQYRTTNHLPLFSILPFCPDRLVMDFPVRARLPGVSGEILAHASAGRTSSENTCSSFSDPILVWRPRTARWWEKLTGKSVPAGCWGRRDPGQQECDLPQRGGI